MQRRSATGGISFATVCQLAGEAGADLSAIAKKYKGKSGAEQRSDTKDEEVPCRTFEEWSCHGSVPVSFEQYFL